MNGLGIVSGIATAMLWTATAVCFEMASKRLGSWTVNVLRLVIAAGLFVGLSLIRTGTPGPQQLTADMWRDLSLSGIVGFVVGDAMLFRAFVLIGARLTMLIYASVPAMTALGGYAWLGEMIGGRALLGMAITAVGIAMSILANPRPEVPSEKRHRRQGILLAIGGSGGQAVGLLLGKRGSVGLDAFAATEVRVLAGVAGFLVLTLASRRMGSIASTVGAAMLRTMPQHAGLRSALGVMTLGAVLGPFLGVSLGLLSVQLLPAGVASTLMSTVPVLLVPVSALVFHESVGIGEVLGTLTAIAGVAMLAF